METTVKSEVKVSVSVFEIEIWVANKAYYITIRSVWYIIRHNFQGKIMRNK